MNKSIKFSLSTYYSPSHTNEKSINYIPISSHYINLFIAGDGCLSINLKGKRFGLMYLSIGQHINKRLLLESIVKYFKNSTKISSNGTNILQINFSGVRS